MAAAGDRRSATYLAPGEVPDLTPGEASLDPKLAEIRDAEIKANDVEVFSSFEEPTIDPALVKARDEEIKRLGGEPIKADANLAEDSADAPTPAKKATSRRSTK
jgi:hypothetical protein